MIEDVGRRIRLGAFVSLGIAILIVGIYFIGERQELFRRTFRVSGVFRDVVGLQEGNNVRFSGINVGTVDNISIVSDSSVRVEILIGESTRQFIKKDARASIGSEGLMGNKVLIMSPGTGGQKEIENNDTVQTAQPANMDEMLTSLKTTIDHASSITDDLAKITDNIQAGRGTIGRLVMNKSDAEKVDSILVNLKEGSAGFRIFVEKAKKSWLLWGF
jgi:phospholipid/cholesterol/gamma-HCH transport system substrate-binding protein